MAILVKYVVVFHGKEDMVFSTRKEAEAHDTMLNIAERLSTFLQKAELPIADETLEALTIFMAQHRTDLGIILKGGKQPVPTVHAQAAVGEGQDTQDEIPASAPKRAKATSRTAVNKSQTTA